MKVFLIGLDGATWKLLNPWIERGELPVLKKMISKGCSGVLKSTIPTQSIPAIPALITGRNPAKLGIFDFTLKDGTLVSSKYINGTIWDILNNYGYKTCVVNVTGTYPPKKINGVLVTGLLTPSPHSNFTYPKELKNKLKNFHPEYWPSEIGLTEPGRERELLDYVLNIAKRKYNGLKTILKDDQFDFIMYWIYETDEVQHYLWHRKDLLLEFYKWVDGILGELTQDFKEYTFFIVSDHGFSSSPKYKFHVNTWLAQEGYLVLKNRVIQYIWNKIQSYLINHLSLSSIKKLSNIVFITKKTKDDSSNKLGYPNFTRFRMDVNWKKTKAIQELYGIRILIKDAESYDKIREEIIHKLKKLEVNGKKIVKEIWKREEIYRGEYANETPDIIFLLDDEYIANSVISKEVFGKHESTSITGDHHYARDGIIITYGRYIKENYKLNNAEILDITPTVLYMFGVPIPKDVDGRILKEIFKTDIESKIRQDEKVRIKRRIKELKL